MGIEITSEAVRIVALSGNNANRNVLSAVSAGLQPGILAESYGLQNIQERDALLQTLKNCLNSSPALQSSYRAALSLPDGVFRVQTLEFDELPGKNVERERLIRWRLEKLAAFDLSDTILRYEVLQRKDSGFTILACIAKKAVIAQYESVLLELGIEPWSVGLSSFFTLNFYAPYMTNKSAACALIHVTRDSFTTIVSDNGRARFYRSKDIKRGNADEINFRLMRDIEDSLHFYAHMDRTQQSEVEYIYLAGEPAICDVLARELKTETSIDAEVLSPDIVFQSGVKTGAEMAAALGAVKTL